LEILPGRKPETFQIDQEMAQVGATSAPSAATGTAVRRGEKQVSCSKKDS